MKRMMLILVVGLAAALMVATASADTPPAVPHYKCYQISGAAPGVTVKLATQFGTELGVVVGPPTRLCLAAKKGIEGDLTVPDVECYQITGHIVGGIWSLQTQFGTTTNVAVGAPNELCVPVAKAIFPAVPAAPPAAPHYKCYDIPGKAPAVSPVTLQTKVGTVTYTEPNMTVNAPTRLCLPAVKNDEGYLSDSEPHVECFGITGTVPGIPNLNLQTQFDGLQENVAVGVPKELCVPALKQGAVGVGGVQNLPDVAGNTDSGGPSLPYAAIAGAAMGLVVLGAGGWYARRRWLS